MDLSGGPRPVASIVIPLWNKVAYTRACLVRLAAATPPGTYEVVLVDNGSTDSTSALLGALSGDVRIIRNERNLGFARACNQGAAAARGRHLVFLNNDTEPHPGWLEPLLEVLDSEPDVGVVGSKLLYPNGLVQHAGVWMVVDEEKGELHGCHRLCRSVPDDPLVSERADLQAVTGAALAIRRDLFESLGGFDEGYWNGNEDVDLCLKARGAGFRVVYEPRSCLTHHESVSGPERFSGYRENVGLLIERWSGRTAPDVVGNNGIFRRGDTAVWAGFPPKAGAVVREGGRRRPDAVNVIGYLGPGGRPGRTVTMAAELLSAAGVPHDVSAYHRSWPWDAPPAYSLNGTGDSCGIVLACAEPDALTGLVMGRGPGFVDDRYLIALWGWPGTSVPEMYLDSLRMAHEFWVPSDALREHVNRVCAAAVTLPAVPPGPSSVAEQLRGATGTAEVLTFTASVDLAAGASPADAGNDAALAISAFTAAFGAGDGPKLLVGVTGGRHLPWQVEGLVGLTRGDPRITVLDLDSAGIGGEDLAAAGDCHLAVIGARGFAPVTLAAMQAGAPVVVMADPANPRVLTPGNAYVIDPAWDDATLVARTAETMRAVADDPGQRSNRGRRAAADISRRRDRARAVEVVRRRIVEARGHLRQVAQTGTA